MLNKESCSVFAPSDPVPTALGGPETAEEQGVEGTNNTSGHSFLPCLNSSPNPYKLESLRAMKVRRAKEARESSKHFLSGVCGVCREASGSL